MKVLELLAQEILAAGGKSDLLVFMARPRFIGNVEKIAKAIVDCDWRIPASEMRHRAEGNYRKEFEVQVEMLEHARNLWWTGVLLELGIPFDDFGDIGEPPIPDLYRRQLKSRTMNYPLLLDHGGNTGNKVIVSFVMKSGYPEPAPGQVIEVDGISSISVADSCYFDFDN